MTHTTGTRFERVNPAEWPAGLVVEFATARYSDGAAKRWRTGTVRGHTPQTLRIQPHGSPSCVNKAPHMVRLTPV